MDQVGFHADQDNRVSENLRFVQLTPPGSACSIAIGEGITEMAPGSQTGIQIVRSPRHTSSSVGSPVGGR